MTFNRVSIPQRSAVLVLIACLLWSATVPIAGAAPLPSYHHIFITPANGVKYDWDSAYYGGPSGAYYIRAENGGLNNLHLSTDPSKPYGQVTVSEAQSGTFFVTNTGGRGSDNEIILLVSVRGPIPDDFSVHIRSSGYVWTPAPGGVYNPPLNISDIRYVSAGVDRTFTKADFDYGPQTWKPGSAKLPLYYGQNIDDASTEEYLMFVDLMVGNIQGAGGNAPPVDVPLNDKGAARIEFSFSGLTTRASFNGYAWNSATSQDEGITWTNQPHGSAASGYSVMGVPTPTPTETPNATPSPTVTPTVTETPAITATPTETPNATPTPTVTPTVTETSMATPTPTATATGTPTGTPTSSLTPTGTVTPDETTTIPTAEPTEITTTTTAATLTPTAGPTVSTTPTPQITTTPAPTITSSPGPTGSPIGPNVRTGPPRYTFTSATMVPVTPGATALPGVTGTAILPATAPKGGAGPSIASPTAVPSSAPPSGGSSPPSDGSASRDVEDYTGVTTATTVPTTVVGSTPSTTATPAAPPNTTVLTTLPTTLPFLDIGNLQEYSPVGLQARSSSSRSSDGGQSGGGSSSAIDALLSSDGLPLLLLLVIGVLVVLLALAGLFVLVLLLVLVGVVAYLFLRHQDRGSG
jgi:hypothetical protein